MDRKLVAEEGAEVVDMVEVVDKGKGKGGKEAMEEWDGANMAMEKTYFKTLFNLWKITSLTL